MAANRAESGSGHSQGFNPLSAHNGASMPPSHATRSWAPGGIRGFYSVICISMSDELALGQREVVADGTHLFTEEEVALMAANGTSPDEVLEFVRTSGTQTLNAAIGGVVAIKAGAGQERNEPFSDDASKLSEEEKTSE